MAYRSAALLLLLLLEIDHLVGRSIGDDIATIRQRVLEMVIWPEEQHIPQVVQLAMQYNRTMNSSC